MVPTFIVVPSIDQMYAHEFGQDTPLPSIQHQAENEDASGACAVQLQLCVSEHDQLVDAHDAAADDLQPAMAFEELFGSGGSEADRAQRRKLNRSILDGVLRSVARLKQDLESELTEGGSTRIWTTSARWSGGFSPLRRTTPIILIGNCRMHRLACPITGTSM